MATLPNSGSTAFAKLVESSTNIRLLNSRGEGQWLVPAISSDGSRWDPNLQVDYNRVRAVWVERALSSGRLPATIFDKSPPNMVRMRKLADTFARDFPVDLIVYTRDPLAVCASWLKRYSPTQIAGEWNVEALADENLAEEDILRLLGELCGSRMEMLESILDLASLHVSYEALTESSQSVIARTKAAIPALADVDTEADLRVKDYAPQRLRNMNAEQSALLSEDQQRHVRSGLMRYAKSIEKLGYEIG